MQIYLDKTGLFNPKILESWSESTRKKIKFRAIKGMKHASDKVAIRVQNDVKLSLKIKNKSFHKSFKASFIRSAGGMPAISIGSKVPWAGSLTRSSIIRAKSKAMIVPVGLKKHISQRRLSDILTQLKAKNRLGISIKNNVRYLFYIRRVGEQGNSKPAEWRKRKDTLLAVMVRQVKMRKKLNIKEIVNNSLSYITSEMLREITRR